MKKCNLVEYFLVIIITISLLSCSNAETNKQNRVKQVEREKLFSAEITFTNGSKESVNNFRRETVGQVWYLRIRTDVPTTTYTNFHDINVDIGPYNVTIPFEIIKSASFKERIAANRYTHVKVLLGNGLEIEGGRWNYFKGNTNLGESKFEVEKINKIVFNHTALDKYSAPLFGTHRAIIQRIDGKSVEINKAGFLRERVNENGCYIGDECVEMLGFEVKGGGHYDIPWNKIAAVVHDKPEIMLGMLYADDNPFKLITNEGKELFGSCNDGVVTVSGVKGVINFNGDYDLLVTVPLFKNTYKKLEFK